MNQVKKSDREHKLMYKAFELSLLKPTTNQLAKTFLANEDCNRIQSENNFRFLNRVRDVIDVFVERNELEYEKYNKGKTNPECECDYDCECYLSDFIMPAFNNLAIKFEPYIDDCSLVNHILEEFAVEEKERLLRCNLRELLRLALYKGLAYLAFNYQYYDVSCWHHEAAVLIYGGVLTKERFDPSEYIEESKILSLNYKKIGAKGGSQKALNYREPQQKALIYHDKHLSKKNKKGKYNYSNDKAAREIISYFESKSESLGYAERSLSNIISKHRNNKIKD